MATTLLAHNHAPRDAVACGVGKTRQIADDRALRMWMERVERNRNPSDEQLRDLAHRVRDGEIAVMCF